jgi:hypothetical protein
VQCLDSHISTCFNKDTRYLFMFCIVLMCQLYHVDLLLLFVYFCSLFNFSIQLLFDFCFHLILLFFIVHCPLFKRKRFYSDPGLYSRYFDPVVQEVPSSSMQVNKHHTSDCTDFVLVWERVAYYDHRHRGI